MDMPLAKQAESNPREVEFAYVDAIPLLELEAVRFYQTCFYCQIPAPFILDGRALEGLTSLYYRRHDRHVFDNSDNATALLDLVIARMMD